MDIDDKPNKFLGLSCGTFVAWLAVPLIHFASLLFEPNSTDIIGGLQFLGLVMLPLYVMFGLPIAAIICFTFGGIAWYIFEALNMVKMRHALIGGAAVGTIISGWIYLMERETTAPTELGYLAVPILIGIVSSAVTHYFGYYDTYKSSVSGRSA